MRKENRVRHPSTQGPRLLTVAAAVAVALAASACSKSGGAATPTSSARPRITARIEIVSPTNGQVIHGSDVTVRVALTGARIVPATTKHIVPDQGHLHVFLDNQIVGMNFQLTDEVSNVKPGMHVLRVEFVASDHLPFDPRVFEAVTFQVDA
jgi:hypothetical protein